MKPVSSMISDTFIIHGQVEMEATNVFTFYYQARYNDELQVLGSITGSVNCPVFSMRLRCLRNKLDTLFDGRVTQRAGVLHEVVKQRKQLDDQQKYGRKMSMLMKEYARRREQIDQSSDMFKDDLYQELEESRKATIEKLKEIYNQ